MNGMYFMNINKPVQRKYAWGDHHPKGLVVVRACLPRRRSELVLEPVGPFMEVACILVSLFGCCLLGTVGSTVIHSMNE